MKKIREEQEEDYDDRNYHVKRRKTKAIRKKEPVVKSSPPSKNYAKLNAKNSIQLSGEEVFLTLIPKRIKTLRLFRNQDEEHRCAAVCTVEWQEESNGSVHPPTRVPYEYVRERYPQLLCDYFEKHIKYID